MGLSKAHKLSCFLSGLEDEIRLPIPMLAPKSLNEAFEFAKIQEKYLISSKKNFKVVVDHGKPSNLGVYLELRKRLNQGSRFHYKSSSLVLQEKGWFFKSLTPTF